jgi:hypothetical protein
MVGIPLYVSALVTSPITQLAYMAFGTKKYPLDWFTELYVFVVLIVSVLIYYFVPDLAWLSTIFSVSTVIMMLNVVFLQQVFGSVSSAERSLLLFMFNAAQIVVMFGTWYQCRYPKSEALHKSILTFATISHADKIPCVAMAQIATDFVLLFIFLSFVVSQLGSKNGVKRKPR